VVTQLTSAEFKEARAEIIRKVTGRDFTEVPASKKTCTDLPSRDPTQWEKAYEPINRESYVTGDRNPNAVPVSRSHNREQRIADRALVSDSKGGACPRVTPTKFVPSTAKWKKEHRRLFGAFQRVAREEGYAVAAPRVKPDNREKLAALLAAHEKLSAERRALPIDMDKAREKAEKLAAFKAKQKAHMEYRKGNPTKRDRRKLVAMELASRIAA
jgi:hypothetical protein